MRSRLASSERNQVTACAPYRRSSRISRGNRSARTRRANERGTPPWQNIGSGTRYDLATGSIADAHANRYGPGTCLKDNAVSPPYSDTRANPAAGQGYYYMVRSQNACGTGTYGTASRDQHGSSGGSSCP